MNDLITDASAASEAAPDAQVFALLNEVREARKQALRQIADDPQAVRAGSLKCQPLGTALESVHCPIIMAGDSL